MIALRRFSDLSSLMRRDAMIQHDDAGGVKQIACQVLSVPSIGLPRLVGRSRSSAGQLIGLAKAAAGSASLEDGG